MTTPLRRVLLVSPYALSIPGGAQTQVVAMAHELRSRDLDVLVASPGAPREDLRAAGVVHVAQGAVLRVPANGSRAPITLSPRAARAFASVAATLRDGVVHVHEPFAPISSYPLLRAHAQATVGTLHRGGGGPAYVVGRPLIRRLARGLDVLVAVSDHAAATIRHGAGLQAEVLFNGIELATIDAVAPTPTVAPTIAFLGRHEERKGLQVLLAALERLDLPIECWVIGSGPQTRRLRERHARDARIRWLGPLDDDEVRARLRGADVLCVPSLGGESFGMVPLEGMAAGTAVVASDIDGYRAAVGGFATLVAPGDPVALAEALRAAITRPKSAKDLAAARAHAASYSMAALVDRYLERYELARARHAASRGGETSRR